MYAVCEDLEPLYFESGCNWEEGRLISTKGSRSEVGWRGEERIGLERGVRKDARTRPEFNTVLSVVEVKLLGFALVCQTK